MRFTMLMVLVLLTGCSNLNLKGVASTSASAVTTGVTYALGAGAPLAVVSGIAAGATVEAVVPEAEEPVTDILKELPPEQREAYLKQKMLWDAVEKWGLWVIGGIFGLLILCLLLPGVQIQRLGI